MLKKTLKKGNKTNEWARLIGCSLSFLGDAEDEDRKRQEEQFIVGPGGTTTPRAWTGWRSGQETDKRRRKWGEHQVSPHLYCACVLCRGASFFNLSHWTTETNIWTSKLIAGTEDQSHL